MRKLIRAILTTNTGTHEIKYTIFNSHLSGRSNKFVVVGQKSRYWSRRECVFRIQSPAAEDDQFCMELDRYQNYWIRNLSKSGTWINGKELGEGLKYQIKDGDVVNIGTYRLDERSHGRFVIELWYLEDDGTELGFDYPATRIILNHLSIEDLKRARLVSKDWQIASQRLWKDAYFTLSIEFNKVGSTTISKLLNEPFEKPLEQIENLKLTDLTTYNDYDAGGNTHVAKEYIWMLKNSFTNVERLSITIIAKFFWQMEMWDKVLDIFAPNLTSLSFEVDYGMTEILLDHTFLLSSQFVKLKNLDVKINRFFLTGLEVKIKRLFDRIFVKMPRLEALSIGEYCNYFIMNSAAQILGSARELKSLKKVVVRTTRHSSRKESKKMIPLIAALEKGIQQLELPILYISDAPLLQQVFQSFGRTLKICTIRFGSRIDDEEETLYINNLPSLQSLTINLNTLEANIGLIFRSIVLPKLESLRIKDYGFWIVSNAEYDRSFPILNPLVLPRLSQLQVPGNFRNYTFFKNLFCNLRGFKGE